MRYFSLALALLIISISLSCEDEPIITNLTRPGGYALGENVKLAFSITGKGDAPDSLKVMVFEKKTEYTYDLFATPIDSVSGNLYECRWDGRKPDGSWPAGGRYWVYAIIPDEKVVSDTVEIGLTD